MSIIFCAECQQQKDSDWIEFHTVELADGTTEDICEDCCENTMDKLESDAEKWSCGMIHAGRCLNG